MSAYQEDTVLVQLALLPFLPAQHLMAALKMAHIPCTVEEEASTLLDEKQHQLPRCRVLVHAVDLKKAAAVLHKLLQKGNPPEEDTPKP